MFGRPMEYWSEMPRWHAAALAVARVSISDPDDALTLDAYEATLGRRLARPVELADFVAYGRWFAEQAAPFLDGRRVVRIDTADPGFGVALADGETVLARSRRPRDRPARRRAQPERLSGCPRPPAA